MAINTATQLKMYVVDMNDHKNIFYFNVTMKISRHIFSLPQQCDVKCGKYFHLC